jgi:hypothetical protein
MHVVKLQWWKKKKKKIQHLVETDGTNEDPPHLKFKINYFFLGFFPFFCVLFILSFLISFSFFFLYFY